MHVLCGHALCVHVYVCVRMCMNCRSRKNRRAAREHFPYLCTSPEEHMQVSGAAIKINGSFSRHIETCSTAVPPEPAHKRHACHAKCKSMSPSATPATQRAAASTASTGTQARHQSQPSAISATPATQSDDPCRQVPRLPRQQPCGDKLCVSKW